MSFFDAFSLFLSYHEYESARSSSDHSRKEFKEFFYHPKHDIPVYILSKKFIAVHMMWTMKDCLKSY